MRYKKNVPADETERLAQELSECAQISADLDQRMQNIRTAWQMRITASPETKER